MPGAESAAEQILKQAADFWRLTSLCNTGANSVPSHTWRPASVRGAGLQTVNRGLSALLNHLTEFFKDRVPPSTISPLSACAAPRSPPLLGEEWKLCGPLPDIPNWLPYLSQIAIGTIRQYAPSSATLLPVEPVAHFEIPLGAEGVAPLIDRRGAPGVGDRRLRGDAAADEGLDSGVAAELLG